MRAITPILLCILLAACEQTTPPTPIATHPPIDLRNVGKGGERATFSLVHEGRTYTLNIVGKWPIVGALVSPESGPALCNVRLSESQIDGLNQLINSPPARTNGDEAMPVAFDWDNVQDNRTPTQLTLNLDPDSPVVQTFAHVIRIAQLPEYTVKPGDTLARIVQGHGGTTADWLAVNPGLGPDLIRIGDHLKIPPAQ